MKNIANASGINLGKYFIFGLETVSFEQKMNDSYHDDIIQLYRYSNVHFVENRVGRFFFSVIIINSVISW